MDARLVQACLGALPAHAMATSRRLLGELSRCTHAGAAVWEAPASEPTTAGRRARAGRAERLALQGRGAGRSQLTECFGL